VRANVKTGTTLLTDGPRNGPWWAFIIAARPLENVFPRQRTLPTCAVERLPELFLGARARPKTSANSLIW
jgi:hypothetical protein